MEKMLSLADEEGIETTYHHFKPPLYGLYIKPKGHSPMIELNTMLRRHAPALRSVMAEELGHHFTTTGVYMYQPFSEHFTYMDKQNVDKCEYKALKWAAQYLISDDALIEALQDGITSTAALAEHFVVMPYIVEMRLKLFEQSKAYQEMRQAQEW